MKTSIIDQLRQQRDHELSKAQKYLQKKQQAENQLARLENKQRYLSQKERSHRTHQLCNIGGAVLHFWPEAEQLTKAEFYELLERLATLPEVNEMFRQAMQLHHQREGGG